jgi:DNA-binding beta-propeller fold protein YncE
MPLATDGYLLVDGSADLVALSDTTVLLANRVASRLDVYDLCLESVTRSWDLPGTPGDFDFDRETRSVYVTLEDSAALARVHLDATGVEVIDLESPALSVVVGQDDRAFARLDGSRGPIAVIDTTSNSVLDVASGTFGEVLAYDRSGDRLITAGRSGYVYVYTFARDTNTFGNAENPFDVAGGSSCDEAVISPDGRHLALVSGGGNIVTRDDPAYALADYSPGDLKTTHGFFDVGHYPAGAAFSPGSTRFYTSRSDDGAIVFDVATHARITAYPQFRTGSGPSILSVSPSGRVLAGKTGVANISALYWRVLGERGDCSGGGGGTGGQTGMPDLGESDEVCTSAPITCPDDSELPATGTRMVEPTDALVALSDTTTLVANKRANRLEVVDLCSDEVRWAWQLPSAPGRVAIDRASRFLAATLSGATSVALISLDSSDVRLVDIPEPAVSVAIGNDGVVFASLDDGHPRDQLVAIIAGDSSTVAGPLLDDGMFLGYHLASDRLLVAGRYGALRAYEFDRQSRELSPAESSGSTGYPCFDVVVAPNQSRVFMPCSNSTSPTPPTQGADFNPEDLTAPFGTYASALSAGAAAFTPGSSRLFAGTSSRIVELDAAGHTEVGSFAATYNALLSVAPSGRVLYAVRQGGQMLTWFVRSEPFDCE